MHDVDIFVTEKLWKELLKTQESEDGRSIQLSSNIEAIRTWFPGEWNVKELIAEADIIEGVRFAKLERVYQWKKQRMAPKDEDDIKTLEAYFKTKKSP